MKTLAAALVLLGAPGTEEPTERWYRGNTHVHTDRSDGNASPQIVAEWYRRLGFHFIVITDHDQVTPVAALNARLQKPGEFLVIAGEGVSASHEGRPVHLNGLAMSSAVAPLAGKSVPEVIDANARAIRRRDGVPQLNHPNLGWFMTFETLLATQAIHHLEILNAHPVNNSWGGGGAPSAEELWDRLLSEGRLFYGIASDDAHDYESFAPTPTDRGPSASANPGRAWIMVRARELSADAIVASLDAGDFYASTGVEFLMYQSDPEGIRLRLPESYRYKVRVPGELRYRTFFIGKDGEVLKRDDTAQPTYLFDGSERYVRVRVEASDGTRAWTQPVFPTKPE